MEVSPNIFLAPAQLFPFGYSLLYRRNGQKVIMKIQKNGHQSKKSK